MTHDLELPALKKLVVELIILYILINNDQMHPYSFLKPVALGMYSIVCFGILPFNARYNIFSRKFDCIPSGGN